jgi:myosin heavy subunit
MGKTLFVIKHTPRDVEYDTLGFKAKNKDEVGKSLVDTLTHSTNPVVVDITNTKHGEDGTTTTTATTNK